MQIKCSFFNFMLFIVYFGKKKLTPALFVNYFCSPKVTTPKAANSESDEGHYYQNPTVSTQLIILSHPVILSQQCSTAVLQKREGT